MQEPNKKKDIDIYILYFSSAKTCDRVTVPRHHTVSCNAYVKSWSFICKNNIIDGYKIMQWCSYMPEKISQVPQLRSVQPSYDHRICPHSVWDTFQTILPCNPALTSVTDTYCQVISIYTSLAVSVRHSLSLHGSKLLSLLSPSVILNIEKIIQNLGIQILQLLVT